MKKHDFILIGIILLAAISVFAALHFAHNEGSYVTVEVDKKAVAAFPLNEDTKYVIKTENGSNTLVIKDGFAGITEADCPDKICVHHKKINKNGESIICLPHRVVVTVTDSSDNNEIDAEV